jgi:hypothetical protein
MRKMGFGSKSLTLFVRPLVSITHGTSNAVQLKKRLCSDFFLAKKSFIVA